MRTFLLFPFATSSIEAKLFRSKTTKASTAAGDNLQSLVGLSWECDKMDLQPRGAWQNKLVNWLLFYAAFLFVCCKGEENWRRSRNAFVVLITSTEGKTRKKWFIFINFSSTTFLTRISFVIHPHSVRAPKKEDTKARKLLNKLAEFEGMECRGSATLCLADVRHCRREICHVPRYSLDDKSRYGEGRRIRCLIISIFAHFCAMLFWEVEFRWMENFSQWLIVDLVEWRLAKWNLLFVLCSRKKMPASMCVSQGYSRFFELLLVFFLFSSASLNPFVGTSGVNVRAPFMIARCCCRCEMSRMSFGECFASHFGGSSRCRTVKHYLWNIPRNSHAWQEREEKKTYEIIYLFRSTQVEENTWICLIFLIHLHIAIV